MYKLLINYKTNDALVVGHNKRSIHRNVSSLFTHLLKASKYNSEGEILALKYRGALFHNYTVIGEVEHIRELLEKFPEYLV